MTDKRIYVPPGEDIEFPDPRFVEGDVIAVGGNLSPGMLLSAYRRGIFPWFSDDDPILWWSLDPRFVIFPSRVHISRSLRRTIRKDLFTLTIDTDFEGVLAGCRDTWRPGQDGTWITEEMFAAYIELHRLGYAHSVETRQDGRLVGGLYGVSLGGCFYGESMFTHVSDASKIAFTALCGILDDNGFGMVDCQQHTRHLGSFGAVDMPRARFLDLLATELEKEGYIGNWGDFFPAFPASNHWNRLRGTGGSGK